MLSLQRICLVILIACLLLCSCDDRLPVIEMSTLQDDTQRFSYTDSSDTWLLNQSPYAKASKLVGYGDYLYFKDSKSFARYNIKTGIKTYICNDPVCSHTTKDCPLFGYTDFGAFPLIHDDKLYYFVSYKEGIYKNGIFDHVESVNNFSCYDTATQKYRVIKKDFRVNIVEYILYENNFFYYQPYQDDSGNYIYYLNSIDLDTNVTTEKLLLAGLDGTMPYNILTAFGGKIYFSSYLSGELFAYDIADFSFRTLIYQAPDGYNITHIAGQEDAFYFLIQNSDCSDQKLCHCDLTTGKTIVLHSFSSPLYYIYYTESYAYFTYDEKKSVGTTADTHENIVLPASKIYRIKLSADAPAEEFIFEFSNEMSMYSISSFVVSGNYIYAYYISWVPSGSTLLSSDGYNSISDRIIMRINIETGEIFYIK